MRQNSQMKGTQFQISTKKMFASDLSKHRVPTPTQQQQLTPNLKNKIKHKNSIQSIQNNKIQRRSNSGRMKRFRQSKLDISQVYIKKPLIENINSSSTEQLLKRTPNKNNSYEDQDLLKQGQRQNQQKCNNKYKRPLTPHKSQQQIIKKLNKNKKFLKQSDQCLNNIINEKDIQLIMMQQKLVVIEEENIKEKEEKQKIEALYRELGHENNRIKKKCKELQDQVNSKSVKLSNIQNILLQNQNSLAQTKNNLQKLKKIIKQNRINQLQKQIKKLQFKIQTIEKQNQILKVQNTTLIHKQNKLKQDFDAANLKLVKLQSYFITKEKSYLIQSMKQQYLTKQLAHLRDKINIPKDQKQRFLEQTIINLKKELLVAQEKIKKDQIKMNFLVRKEQELFNEYKKQKQKQHQTLKQKFRKFLIEYQKIRKQYAELKINLSMIKRQKNQKYVQQEEISYQLTPQKN